MTGLASGRSMLRARSAAWPALFHLALASAPLLAPQAVSAAPGQLRKEVVVSAAPDLLWRAWTTAEGARTFFAPDARIEAKPGGAYELYFAPEAAAGSRGCEGCTVQAVEIPRRLAFTWSFPPSIPTLRESGAMTQVTVDLLQEGPSTRVRLTQEGWREGPDWELGHAYFDRAWDLVLGRLERRFRTGPINWRDPDAETAAAISRLNWMAGRWRGESEGRPFEEHWIPGNGCLSGFARETEGANTTLFEIMSLEPGEDGAELRIRHFGPGLREAWEEKDQPMVFRLIGADDEEAAFEGRGAQAGERLSYRRKGPDQLVFTGEFLHRGQQVIVEIALSRLQP